MIYRVFSSLLSFLVIGLGFHGYALGAEEEDLRACLMATKEKPCKVEGYAGSFPNLNDPALGTNLNGCYDFNFTRRADALSLNAPAQCPDDRWPIYVDVRKTSHCPNDKEGKCETGSYIRAQVVYSVQGAGHAEGKSSSKFGYIKLPQSIPWILSATTVLDRMEEVCKGLKSQRYEWSSTTRACTKKPEYICDDLGLTWDNTKKTCTPPALNCPASKCSDKGNYCSGYLYRPQSDWCFCSGTKTDGRCAIPIPPAAPAAREVPVQCEFCSHPRMRGYQDPDGTGPFGPKKKCNCRCKEELIQNNYNYFVWDSGDCKLNCTINEQYCHDRSKNFNSGSCSCEGFYCNQAIEAAKCTAGQTFNSATCHCDDPGCTLSQANCASGQTFNSASCACEGGGGCSLTSCPPNFVLDNPTQSNCACRCGFTNAQCANGVDTNSCTCLPGAGCGISSCPNSNYTLQNPGDASCSCACNLTNAQCPNGVNSDCTCKVGCALTGCPGGQELKNPGQQSCYCAPLCSLNSCPAGEDLINPGQAGCFCQKKGCEITSCPAGQTLKNPGSPGCKCETTVTSCNFQCFPVNTTGSSSALGLHGYGKIKIATCAKGRTINVRLDPYEVPNQVRVSGDLNASSPWVGYSYYGNSTAGGYCQHPGEWGSYLSNANTFWTSPAITGDGDVFIEVMTLNGDAPECPGSPDLNDGWSLNAYCN